MISLKNLWLSPHDCSITLRIIVTIVSGIILGQLSYQGLTYVYDHVRQPLVIHEVNNQTPEVRAGGHINVEIVGTFYRSCPASGKTVFSKGERLYPGEGFDLTGMAGIKLGRRVTRVRSLAVPENLPTGVYVWDMLLQVECTPNSVYFPPVPPIYVKVINDAEPPPP